MGTRAVYGFRKNNKYKITYSNWDGDYEWLGTAIVKFINTTAIKEMNNIFNKIILVDILDKPNRKQIKECKKYANLEISTRTLYDFRCLLSETIGHLEFYRDTDLKYMINSEEHLNEYSYQYIINLDNNKLEIYWYEILVNSYNLNDVPTSWIEECTKNIDILYEKWKKGIYLR